MKTWLKISLVGVVLLVGVTGVVWQRQAGATMRRSVALMRQAQIDLVRENARLKEIVATRSETEAAQQVREEIARRREEIAFLEKATPPGLAPRPAPMRDVQFGANRDPEKGPVRLEHFRDMGRATPSAAFQTAVWAMTKGNDEALAPLFAVSPAGREKLQAILARMSPAMQARYTPPEKIVGVLLARDVLKEEGFEIAGASEPDPAGQVILRVLRVRDGRKNKLEKKIPLVRGPDGWQLSIPDRAIDDIPQSLESASMYVPPRIGGAAQSRE